MREQGSTDALRGWRARAPALAELGAGLGVLILLMEGLQLWLSAPVGLRYTASTIYLAIAALILCSRFPGHRWLGWANRITLLRGVLVTVIAGAVAFPEFMARHADAMVGLALAALLLDGMDGWVARLTHSATSFGARFDMELDAFFILVLCAALIAVGKVGGWVVAIGAMRYLFLVAAWYWHWLSRPLPESHRRKVICVWQVISLLFGLLPVVPSGLATALAAVSLLLLCGSFLVDIRWLRHRKPDDTQGIVKVEEPVCRH